MTNYSPSVQQLMNRQGLKQRKNVYQSADIAAVHAMTQAAINVELFTIPLYMTSMYSIQGMHQINGGNNFYKGRQWPGGAPVANPLEAAAPPKEGGVDSNNPYNKKAFNSIFSVFIQEMLHLQLAANVHCALNQDNRNPDFKPKDPTFTSKELQQDHVEGGKTYPYAWKCYGDDITTIPHIIDLKDIKDDECFFLDEGYANQPLEERKLGMNINQTKVKLSELNDNAITLFMAIEASEDLLKSVIKPECMSKYFPTVPFNDWDNNWTGNADNMELPMFGSIAHMYTCLAEYLNIEYEDGTTLLELVFNSNPVQQDLFNYSNRKGGKGKAGHPCSEFPAMGELQVTAADPETAKLQIFNIISGICDQGEGGMLKVNASGHAAVIDPAQDKGVKKRYQPDRQALSADYPSYNDEGKQEAKSASAEARANGGEIDHFDRFRKVAGYMKNKQVTTWVDWHAQGNQWTGDLLKTSSYDPEFAKEHYPTLPAPEDVAGAMDRLNQDFDTNYKVFSHVAAGSIAGLTTVLDEFWSHDNFFNDPIDFPYPSMSGSGDRISICWAIFGKAPNLNLGAFPRKSGHITDPNVKSPVNHACQGLGFNPDGSPDLEQHDACATMGVFHTCKGSNQCAGEGGCGFVHDATVGGGGCGGSNPSGKGSGLFSAPGNNKCSGFGGCAVPISASQLFPYNNPQQANTMHMQLFNLGDRSEYAYEKKYVDPKTHEEKEKCVEGFHYPELETMNYEYGEGVYDVAWRAYAEVLEKNGHAVPEKPKPSDLRLAFPPST